MTSRHAASNCGSCIYSVSGCRCLFSWDPMLWPPNVLKCSKISHFGFSTLMYSFLCDEKWLFLRGQGCLWWEVSHPKHRGKNQGRKWRKWGVYRRALTQQLNVLKIWRYIYLYVRVCVVYVCLYPQCVAMYWRSTIYLISMSESCSKSHPGAP